MTELYKDPGQPVEARVEDLLARMTLEEKIGQMHAVWLYLDEAGNHTTRSDQFTGSTDPETLKEMLRDGLGQITRPLGTRTVDPAAGVRALNRLQKFMLEETRLGIPVMSHEECLSGLMIAGATLFPSALAFGATWNPGLIEQVGAQIGIEALRPRCRTTTIM